MTADYKFEQDDKIEVITRLSVDGGQYAISSRNIVSSDVLLVEEMVDDKIDPIAHDLDVLSGNFDELCSTTFVKEDISASCGKISSFNLVLTDTSHPPVDSDPHQRYYMSFEMGTIVLKPL